MSKSNIKSQIINLFSFNFKFFDAKSIKCISRLLFKNFKISSSFPFIKNDETIFSKSCIKELNSGLSSKLLFSINKFFRISNILSNIFHLEKFPFIRQISQAKVIYSLNSFNEIILFRKICSFFFTHFY